MKRRTLLLAPLLGGCAAPHLVRGYQPVYQGHEVGEPVLALARARLKVQGLHEAGVERDLVGRARLVGRYRSDEAVDTAFLILRSLVGLQASSPFYPQDVADKRWERAAAAALAAHASARLRQAPPSRKRALVVGINRFMDEAHLRPLQGEDDARLVAARLTTAGYGVQSLFGAQATKQAIEAQIMQLSRELGADDVLFIYVSSHGALPLPAPEGQDARHMSIVAYDSGDILGQRSADATDYLLKLQRTSVRDSLVQALAQQPTRQTRVLVDTCYSGDMLRALDRPGGDALLAERDSISIDAWSRLAQSLRSRYTLLTATSPGELALGPPPRSGVFPSPLSETRQLRGSFFTQTLFEYLQQHGGLIQPAFAEAQTYTAQTARRVSEGKERQTPRMLSTMEAGVDRL